MSKKIPSPIELERVLLEITIEATFEIEKFDNGADIDESIESALTSLQSYGTASITSRRMFGQPKEKQ